MDAMLAPPAAANTAESTAPAAAAPASSAKQTYRLVANPSALAQHVGKKLELTGTIEDPNSAGQAATTASGVDATRPALRVESGKIIAESCGEK